MGRNMKKNVLVPIVATVKTQNEHTDDISRKLSAAVPVTCILCCSFPDCDPQYFGECELCESIVITLVLVKSLGSGWYQEEFCDVQYTRHAPA